MLKSFLHGFSGGLGRTFGRILAYLVIGFIAFLLIYYTNGDISKLLLMEVDASPVTSSIYSYRNSCNSGYYNIYKRDDTVTYGQTSTSYNITWNSISFNGTYNLSSNTYYDMVITFRSNISNSILDKYVDGSNIGNAGIDGIHFHYTTSLCGSITGEIPLTSYNISGSKLTIRFLTGSSMVDYWYFSTLFAFSGSNGVNSVTFEEVDLTGSSGIIQNNTNNTNTIVNNNNQNTQNIIDNQQQNTQDIIDNQNENSEKTNSLLGQCYKNLFDYTNYTYNDSRYALTQNSSGFSLQLVANGNYSGGSFPLTFPLTLKPNTTYYFSSDSSKTVSNNGRADFYIYDGNNSLLDYTVGTDNFSFTTNNTTSYNFKIYITGLNQVTGDIYIFSKMMLFEGSSYSGSYIAYNEEKCISKLDSLNDSQSQLNSYIFSNDLVNLANFQVTIQGWADFFSNPYSELITLPVSLLNKLISASNGTCSAFSLGTLFNTQLSMPCIDLEDYLGSTLWSIIDILSSIGICAWVLLKLYNSTTNMLTFGGENEVKKFIEFPTPMEFLAKLFN